MKKIIMIMAAFALCGCFNKKETLYVYSWVDYIDSETLYQFEDEYNCRVSIDSFDSNESMYAKLKMGATGYDVILPSSYIIPTLIEEKMILKLNHEMLTNVVENYDHSFDEQIYDSELKYSVPYMVTYTGIIYNKNKLGELKEFSWYEFDNPLYTIKTSLLDDCREVIAIGLICNGYSINSTNEEELTTALATVDSMRCKTRKFDSESYKTEIPNNFLTFSQAYSSDSYQIILGDGENGRSDLGFILPKEGFTIACDEFVIPSTSKNVELAHKFIDFMYRTENSLRNMKYNYSPSPNKNAIAELDDDLRNKIIIDSETIKRGQLIKTLDGNTMQLYNKIWDEIKSVKR